MNKKILKHPGISLVSFRPAVGWSIHGFARVESMRRLLLSLSWSSHKWQSSNEYLNYPWPPSSPWQRMMLLSSPTVLVMSNSSTGPQLGWSFHLLVIKNNIRFVFETHHYKKSWNVMLQIYPIIIFSHSVHFPSFIHSFRLVQFLPLFLLLFFRVTYSF